MIAKLKNFMLDYWHWQLLIIVAAAFFIGTGSYNFFTQKNDFIKWSSPDESANYVFTKLYAQENRLWFYEKYNLISLDVIQPRSLKSESGWLKPVSFLGIILIYGKIAGLTSYKIIPYLTPFFAALGLIFYYLLVREIFGRRNGLFSAMLLASFPPFIYYSAHSMFHNVLFVVLLILSLYCAVMALKNPRVPGRNYFHYLGAALSGFFLGLAITTRASELIWLVPAWLILWLYYYKRFGVIKLLIFLFFLGLAMLPAAAWNKILYQSFWRGGYNEMNQSIINIARAGQDLAGPAGLSAETIRSNLAQIKNNFFHFGFWPKKSLTVFYYYFITMFYWLFWPFALGLALFFKKMKKWKKRHFAYFSAYFVISLILIFYYGSWDFHDNPDPASRTIGNSYTRYWLPVYLGAAPLASFFLIKLSNIFSKKGLVYGLRVLMMTAIFFISLKFVLAGSAEGLIHTAGKHEQARQELSQLLELTEERAVIITRYHDKLLFPERKVIVGLFDDSNMIRQYAVLAEYLPLYYYNFTLREQDLDYLNGRRLAEFNLRISQIKRVTEYFTLYKLSLR